ncbi:MAG: T9SS type A sorting domain-containing protein [Saprospiraceae bacterium]|nr:T9SS type A sorting domain-containing protein [Lewinella sp.]
MKNGITRLLLFLGVIVSSTQIHAADYFWVGDGGNWNDLTHWASSSGGAGGAYIALPTADDDVFFNENSFTTSGQVVTLSTNAVCKNMAWTNILGSQMPSLHFSNGVTLGIYGKIDLDSDMNITYELGNPGRIQMLSTEKNTNYAVATNGNTLPNIEFAGAGGKWSVTTTLQVAGELKVTNGTFQSGAPANMRFNVTTNTFVVDGADADLDIARMNITANTRFQISNINTLDVSQGGNQSIINTPHFQIDPTAGNLTFGTVTITGSNGKIDASGLNLEFDGAVTFSASTTNTILGSHTFNEDITFLGYGFSVLLEAGSTQTLDKQVNINAPNTNCSRYITLRSTVSGTAATIAKAPQNASDVVQLSFFNIQDVHIDDGGVAYNSFEATNSFDLGNTDGWTFFPVSGITLYWIGGSGDWSDGNHWSTLSGGSPVNCIPTFADDVVFDENSFSGNNQTVNVNLPNIYFHSMTWSDPDNDRPTWLIPNGSVYVGGSLTLTPSMFVTVGNPTTSGFYFITTESGHTIDTYDGTAFGTDIGFDLANVTFSGSGSASWTLASVLNISGSINFLEGTLNTDDYNILAGDILVDGSAMNLMLTSSEILVENSFQINSIGTLTAGTSNIYTPLFDITPTGLVFSEMILLGTEGILRGTDLTFTDVKLSSSFRSTVYGSHTFLNELQFDQPGMIVEFEAGTTQWVNNLISKGSDCGGQIWVRTTETGSQVTFKALPLSGDIALSYVMLQDNEADPDGQAIKFEALNSQNLGNNSPTWEFTDGGAVGQAFYWIGGEGNWNDGTHWSLTRGGTPANCIPSPIDDVFFTLESFDDLDQQVFLDREFQFCHDMTWEADVVGVPVMNLLAGNNLYIYGSLQLANTSTMNLIFGDRNEDVIDFKSTETSNRVITSGHVIPNINFNGPGGAWQLNSALTVGYTINLTNGLLNTFGSTVTVPQFFVNGSGASLSLLFSTIEVSELFQIDAIGALDPGTSTLNTNTLTSSVEGISFNNVHLTFGEFTELNGNNLIFENLFLDGTIDNRVHGSHTINGTLQFTIDGGLAFFTFDPGSIQTLGTDASLLSTATTLSSPAIIRTSIDEATATFFKAKGRVCLAYANIVDIIADDNGHAAQFGTVFCNVLGNSTGWLLTGLSDCIEFLPVECMEFNATVGEDNLVELYWATAQETNNHGFELQRSIDGRQFEAIAWIEGAGTTSEAQKYSYLDRRTAGLQNAYYRLQQFDLDGTTSYACDVIAVQFRNGLQGGFEVFPNPAEELVKLRWQSRQEGMTLIRLFDQSGRLVLSQEWMTATGNNQQELTIADLPNGIYELVVLPASGQSSSMRIVKQ